MNTEPATLEPAAVAAEPVAVTPEPIQAPENSVPDIDNMTDEQLGALLRGESIEIPVISQEKAQAAKQDENSPIALIKAMASQQQPAPEAVAEPVAADLSPPGDKVEPVAEPEAEKLSAPVTDAVNTDALVAQLIRANPALTPEAALNIVAPDPLAAFDFSEPAAIASLDALASEVDELKEAILSGGDEEGLNSRAQEQRRIDLVEKQAQLAQITNEANTAFSTGRQAAQAKAIELFPDAAIPGTPLWNALGARVQAAGTNPNHPDHGTATSTHAPLALTALVAKELGIKPARPGAKAAPVAVPAAAPVAAAPAAKPAARPVTPMVSGRVGTQQPVDGPSPEALVLKRMRTGEATLAELDAISGMPAGLAFAIRGN